MYMLLWSRKTIRIGAAFILLGMLVRSFIFPASTSAATAVFFPETCLGGWQYVDHAAGKPDFSEPLSDQYSEATAAVFSSGGSAQIFCSNFKGEIPEHTFPEEAAVRFNWDFRYDEEPLIILDPFEADQMIVVKPTVQEEVETVVSEESEEEISPEAKGVATDEEPKEEIIEESATPEPALKPKADATEVEVLPESGPVIEDGSDSEEVVWHRVGNKIASFVRDLITVPVARAQEETDPVQNPATDEAVVMDQEVTISNEPASDPVVSQESVVANDEPTAAESPSPAETVDVVEGPVEIAPASEELAPEEAPAGSSSKEEKEEVIVVDQESELSIGEETDQIEPLATTTESQITAEEKEKEKEKEKEEEVAPAEVKGTFDEESPEAVIESINSLEDLGQMIIAAEERAASQPDYFLELTYSIAGAEPIVFGQASLADAEGKLVLLPEEVVNNWGEIKNLQIGIRPMSVFLDIPAVYLESMSLEVSYTEPVEPAENQNALGLSVRSVDRDVTTDPSATHRCTLDPFATNVSEVDFATVVLRLEREVGFEYSVEVGSLPDGIDVAFVKNSEYFYAPKKKETEIELNIHKDRGASQGSFSIPIIFTKLIDEGKESVAICQMNVMNE